MKKSDPPRDKLLTAKREKRRIVLRDKHRRSRRVPAQHDITELERTPTMDAPPKQSAWNWNPLTWYGWFSHKQVRSWVGHGVTTLAAAAVMTLIWRPGGSAHFALALWASVPAAYYVFVREPMDLAKHLAKGSTNIAYDADSGPLTPQQDRIGDSIAPATSAVALWLSWLMGVAF